MKSVRLPAGRQGYFQTDSAFFRWGAGAVEQTSFENWHTRKGIVSSNLTPTAIKKGAKLLFLISPFLFKVRVETASRGRQQFQ